MRHIVFLFLFTVTCAVNADESSLQALKDKCEAGREARLAPEREALIQSCITKAEKSAEECQHYYADYGAGGRTAAGAGRPRLYNDLPECEALYEAEKNSGR